MCGGLPNWGTEAGISGTTVSVGLGRGQNLQGTRLDGTPRRSQQPPARPRTALGRQEPVAPRSSTSGRMTWRRWVAINLVQSSDGISLIFFFPQLLFFVRLKKGYSVIKPRQQVQTANRTQVMQHSWRNFLTDPIQDLGTLFSQSWEIRWKVHQKQLDLKQLGHNRIPGNPQLKFCSESIWS